MMYELVIFNKADRTTCGSTTGGDTDVVFADIDNVCVGAINVAGSPIAAYGTDFADVATRTFSSCGQEYSTSIFKGCPLFSRVGVGGVVIAGCKSDTVRNSPSVRQKNKARNVVHSGKGLEIGGVWTNVEHIVPFGLRKGAPDAHLVATVEDGVVIAPIGIGVNVAKVITIRSGHIFAISGRSGVGLVGDSVTVPTTGAEAEEVYPIGAVVADSNVVIASIVILI